jgi:adenine-specific DNA-methyltransferase
MQTLLDELQNALLNDERMVIDGKLSKNKVVELSLKLDKNLLKLLLNNEKLKKRFFTDVDGTLVFDKHLFQRFVTNKQFLPDSYTVFKNKIGLSDDGKDYLKEKNDVSLIWPYKDCVLQGGQTKEDAKRTEIFWNETLAPDEIDRLLDPKVLTKVKKIEKNAEEKAHEITSKDNLLLKGNNLLALESLKEVYSGQVKLIYIDPPYNKDTDSFKYNDSFKHSTWLTFLRNRLEISRELLSNEGIIFMHIGDEEMHYLKVMADDIFGREKFIATIPRKTRSGKSDVSWKMSQDFDWLLIYTKKAPKETQLFKRAIERNYHSSDDYPEDEWRLSDLTKQTSIKERPNSDFTLINPKNGNEYPVNPNRSWAVTIDTVDDYIKRGKIVFPGDYDFLKITKPAMRVFKSEEIENYGEDFDKTYVSSDFLNKAMEKLLGTDTYNSKGTDEIVEIFGNKKFDYPKNELLLKLIIEYTTDEGDLVLDFFTGSGTTGAVAHKMGRQYILCEQMDYVEQVTVKRLQKVIEGEQGGISKEVDWKGGGSFVYAELMQYNAQFVNQIEGADSKEKLHAIWGKMQESAFLSYRVNPSAINKEKSSFDELTLEEQKQFLVEVLDKNQLYVNYSEIDDEEFGVSKDDKKLNHQFYSLNKR